jgi:hypothetical protein
MLDHKYKCEVCLKENCKQLEFDMLTKEWTCFECEDKRLKAEKRVKILKTRNSA